MGVNVSNNFNSDQQVYGELALRAWSDILHQVHEDELLVND